MNIIFNCKGDKVTKSVNSLLYNGHVYDEVSESKGEHPLRPVLFVSQYPTGEESIPAYGDHCLSLPEGFVKAMKWMDFQKKERATQEVFGWYAVQTQKEIITFKLGGEFHMFSRVMERVVGTPDLRLNSVECDSVGIDSIGLKVFVLTKMGGAEVKATVTEENIIIVDTPELSISREIETMLHAKKEMILYAMERNTVIEGMEQVCQIVKIPCQGDIKTLFSAYRMALSKMAPAVRSEIEPAVGKPEVLDEVLHKWFNTVREPVMMNGINLKPKKRIVKERRTPWQETKQGREMMASWRETGKLNKGVQS